ncbi:hypothetical protein B296_00003406 [Ensete ventricosum]|uniref:Uncharacterized protein n=1 Tax=Ensete ventricosum TaxID=4639 RepID=A0A427B635_ENSVE|nr:hypothetical protein B296_00003406 [Ensete ventricosum]
MAGPGGRKQEIDRRYVAREEAGDRPFQQIWEHNIWLRGQSRRRRGGVAIAECSRRMEGVSRRGLRRRREWLVGSKSQLRARRPCWIYAVEATGRDEAKDAPGVGEGYDSDQWMVEPKSELRPPTCDGSDSDDCVRASGLQLGVLNLGLYLTTLGMSGLKSNVSGHERLRMFVKVNKLTPLEFLSPSAGRWDAEARCLF